SQVGERVTKMRSMAIAQFKADSLQVDVERFRKSMAGDDPERNEWFKQMVSQALVKLVYQEATGSR
ncbi:MAG: hypothetical protein ABI823_04230, partial [Bryobacteraceae bacterium]